MNEKLVIGRPSADKRPRTGTARAAMRAKAASSTAEIALPVRQIGAQLGPRAGRPEHLLPAIEPLAERALVAAGGRQIFGPAYDRPDAIRRQKPGQSQPQPAP
jgi:hypothetical protein